MASGLTAIDLFCGAGGFSEGFRQAGFHVLAGNDIDEAAGATYTATHRGAVFLPGRIEKISARAILRAAGVKKGELDCLIGGPPCQAFSIYNHKRGMHDTRSQLFKEYLRIVKGVRPSWIVMENVTGIWSAGEGQAVAEIMHGLKHLGYSVETRILCAEQYGVPQERRRVFFIGNRTGDPICWPEPTHGGALRSLVTIRDAIGDLPPLCNGGHESVHLYSAPVFSDYQRTLRRGSKEIHNHVAPSLAPINLERMKHIPQGGSWRDIPFELLPAGMKRAKRSDHTTRYGRLDWSRQAFTIMTKCDVHWGAFIHPEQDRGITVREAARLQSFPDWFQFQGFRTEQYQQVGNAVPPILGKALAEAIIASCQAKTVSLDSSAIRSAA